MNTQKLKEDLKALMRSRGKQQELAEKTGIPQPTLSKFANDPKRDISFTKACKLMEEMYSGKCPIGQKADEG